MRKLGKALRDPGIRGARQRIISKDADSVSLMIQAGLPPELIDKINL